MAAIILFCVTCAGKVLAGAAEDKGLEIAQASDRRDTGWDDVQSDMLMILRNRQGDESRREIRNSLKRAR